MQQKRRVDLLTISAAENLAAEGAAGRREKVVFLTARVHPGESPSSHVLRGLLQFLLGDSRQARRLRQLLVFKVVPMLNPDGVYLGNYRWVGAGVGGRHVHQQLACSVQVLAAGLRPEPPVAAPVRLGAPQHRGRQGAAPAPAQPTGRYQTSTRGYGRLFF